MDLLLSKVFTTANARRRADDESVNRPCDFLTVSVSYFFFYSFHFQLTRQQVQIDEKLSKDENPQFLKPLKTRDKKNEVEMALAVVAAAEDDEQSSHFSSLHNHYIAALQKRRVHSFRSDSMSPWSAAKKKEKKKKKEEDRMN